MNKKFRKIVAATLALTFTLSLAGCGGNKQEQQAQQGEAESSVLKVGMECGYAPFNWTQLDDSNGAVPIQGDSTFANGYDVQIAKKVAESMGAYVTYDESSNTAIIKSADEAASEMVARVSKSVVATITIHSLRNVCTKSSVNVGSTTFAIFPPPNILHISLS